ncbi:MAG: hypothetical protein ACMUEM_03955 [Flavobacteriales bacterium AspAUS03]
MSTKLRIRRNYDFIFDETNQLVISLELNKLLIPSPGVNGRKLQKMLFKEYSICLHILLMV